MINKIKDVLENKGILAIRENKETKNSDPSLDFKDGYSLVVKPDLMIFKRFLLF